MSTAHDGDAPFVSSWDYVEMRRRALAQDDDWLIEFAKLIGKQSRERWELRRRLRPQPLTDEQYDHDYHEDSREWCK